MLLIYLDAHQCCMYSLKFTEVAGRPHVDLGCFPPFRSIAEESCSRFFSHHPSHLPFLLFFLLSDHYSLSGL